VHVGHSGILEGKDLARPNTPKSAASVRSNEPRFGPIDGLPAAFERSQNRRDGSYRLSAAVGVDYNDIGGIADVDAVVS